MTNKQNLQVYTSHGLSDFTEQRFKQYTSLRSQLRSANYYD